MTIAKEIEDQLMYLADPTTRWVKYFPHLKFEACAARRSCLVLHKGLSSKAIDFVESVLDSDYDSIFQWNDVFAQSKQEVIWVLEEALDIAEKEGI